MQPRKVNPTSRAVSPASLRSARLKARATTRSIRAAQPFSLNPTGTLLRRYLAQFAAAVDTGANTALSPPKRGPKIGEPNPLTAELVAARKENARLALHLARAEVIIDIQKKVAALLGIPPMPNDSEP